MQFYEYSILIAIAGWVYSMILLKEGMILGWFGKIICRLPDWICEPLGGCEYCVSGQMAMWFYLYFGWDDYGVDFFGTLIQHVLFITLTIFIVAIINKWKLND